MEPEQSYKELIDELPDLVCRYRPDGTLLYCNRAYAVHHLKTVDELIGTNFLDLIPDSLRPDLVASLARLNLLTPDNPVNVNEHRSPDGLGRVRWFQWIDKATFDPEGRIVEFLSAGRDVNDRREAEDRIAFTARYDELTGLVNRRAILEELERAVVRAQAHDRSLGLLFLDLDGFKRINDERGHNSGDQFLAAAGAALADSVRGGDLVGRIGGDEFILVCTDIGSLARLLRTAERIRLRLDELTPPCRASIGAAMLRPDDTCASLLHRADVAMYEEKALRRGSTEYLG